MAGTRATPKKKKTKRRKDPGPRHIDSSARWTKLLNKDPRMHYVMVNTAGGQEMGVDYYRDALGYTPVTHHKDGPKFAGGSAGEEGEQMLMRGHLVMQILLPDHEELEEYGEDGQTGQADADEQEERMYDATGAQLRRGIGNTPGLSFQVEGSTQEVEGGG